MKKLLFIIVVALSLFSCQNYATKYHVMTNNDSISNAYLIGDGYVGHIYKGADASKLYDIYGESNVRILKENDESAKNDTTGHFERYYVYDTDNSLLFIASASQNNKQIERIVVRSKKFRTINNIGLGSTVAQIREAYPALSVIESDDKVSIFLPSIETYFAVHKSSIAGYDPNFIADISIDSIRQNYEPKSMIVNWFANDAEMFSPRFWKEILRTIIIWSLKELPSIIFLILLFIGLLKFKHLLIKRVKKVAIDRATKDESRDTNEAIKRINTISKISHQVGGIVLWCIFILMLLAKINIDLGPLLASAGIVGFAIGFGAQELVRDYISGFFVLLEDQIRTGDMAIINDVTGLVEKIELRTITLRDPSGVVHVFQNGKINSLANMTKEWSATVLEIGVAYKEDIDNVMRVMREVGDIMSSETAYEDNMLNSVEVLGLDQFGDSAIIIKALIKTRPMQQWAIKREYQRRLKIAFDERGIEIPFPHLSIYAGEATKPFPVELESKTEKK